jgi:hypothetical protein
VSKHAKTHNFSVVFLWIIRYACWWLVIYGRIDQRRRSGSWRDEEKMQVSLCAACLNPCRLAAVGQTLSPWWMQARCLNSVSHLSCFETQTLRLASRCTSSASLDKKVSRIRHFSGRLKCLLPVLCGTAVHAVLLHLLQLDCWWQALTDLCPDSRLVTICTTRFNIQQFYVLPTHCIYVFVWISEKTAIISLCNIN